MRNPRHLLSLAALLTTLPCFALYKVVGPDGKVTYTDRPPATQQGGKVQAISGSGTPVSEQALPFELRQPAGRYPVTLYSSDKCTPCDAGRTYLRQRGIPYVERTLSTEADLAAMQRLEGTTELPVLRIGSQQVKGYAQGEWGNYLDAAGYPRQSALPAGYKQQPAQPLVATQAAPTPAAAAPTEAPNLGQRAPAPTSAPHGSIRF